MNENLITEIQTMYYCENLTIGEIASALRQNPSYVFNVVYRMPLIIKL